MSRPGRPKGESSLGEGAAQRQEGSRPPVHRRSASAPLDDAARLRSTLDDWVERRWLRRLDVVFADFLWREIPDASPRLILAAVLASHQLGHGHACLDLAAALDDPAVTLALPPEDAPAASRESPPAFYPAQLLEQLTLRDWLAALDDPRLVGAGPGRTPLVLAGGARPRLYLRRCWQYEQDIKQGITQRLQRNAALQAALPTARLREYLDALFAGADAGDDGVDWQKVACAIAAGSALTIITGGPGTGKTTTVVKVLAVLQALALDGADGPLRIRLAAPTGKAAARLSESISGAVQRLAALDGLPRAQAVRAAIPTKVGTLHRLLGSRPGTRRFRHDRDNRLALDVLVVDEASMVDLETMAAVLDALPPAGRLILLGDQDQLASVEAGAVLADLCVHAREGRYTPATRDWLARVSGQRLPPSRLDDQGAALDQAVIMLRHSHRFAADSGIGRLAAAVNDGDVAAARMFWQVPADGVRKLVGAACERAFAALVLHGRDEQPPAGAAEVLTGMAMQDLAPSQAAPGARASEGYADYLAILRQGPADTDPGTLDAWAAAVLRQHQRFQLLATLRNGEWGVEGLNRRVARLLFEQGLIAQADGWYAGRPVLVTHNDYALGLMNGDIGITLPVPGAQAEALAAIGHGEGLREPATTLRVAFTSSDGSGRIKWVPPSRLQAVETVYALTVHKSQGSEFEHAVVVLPERLGPILTRELLYTGITRARRRLTLLSPGGEAVLEQGMVRQVRRASGLFPERLDGAADT
ncbi:exodeoxyribonuclease V subunit alpha [Achromobacter aloeverae]|uniref:RecBCD enzyme subunit RecD n=1 Tax=Achromobacter aloeverae TaxID=1750518 RepID=A0A4Q1HJM5_9BURK|nr:exodeoxyribonuclease V subunit alpha [Achromobacter aloeverae]RXN90314.1 exodeoxyribonuclease V subunit alpha [Achromobacter aloeverae]